MAPSRTLNQINPSHNHSTKILPKATTLQTEPRTVHAGLYALPRQRKCSVAWSQSVQSMSRLADHGDLQTQITRPHAVSCQIVRPRGYIEPPGEFESLIFSSRCNGTVRKLLPLKTTRSYLTASNPQPPRLKSSYSTKSNLQSTSVY